MDSGTATGDTALTYASENGHTNVAEVLLEHGAELVRLCLFRKKCQSNDVFAFVEVSSVD